jgi:Mg2+ and Co2+ transporter CorA
MRRTVARLRRHLDFHRPIVHAMLRPDIAFVQKEHYASYFTVLESHFDRAAQALEQTREAMIASFELYATRTSQETNDLVRALTIATVAIGLSAAIAGIFGMNFDIALFHWGMKGFLLITGTIVAATLAIYGVARLRDWV